MATPQFTLVLGTRFDPSIKYPPLTDTELAEHGLELSFGDRCFRFIKGLQWRKSTLRLKSCGCCVDEDIDEIDKRLKELGYQ